MLHKIVICIITALLLSVYFQNCKCTNILLVIEDNGCGIKASDLSRVFEKGFTGSNRNKANATGMGLYLSKKLCDRLGLKLDIASTEKEYTRLTTLHFQKEQFIIFQSNLKTMPTLIRCFKGACIMESFKYNSLQSNST